MVPEWEEIYNSAAATIIKIPALPAYMLFKFVAPLGTIGVSEEVAVGTIKDPVLDAVPTVFEVVPTEVGGTYVEVDEEEDVKVVALCEV
jgi:hypothetical protein